MRPVKTRVTSLDWHDRTWLSIQWTMFSFSFFFSFCIFVLVTNTFHSEFNISFCCTSVRWYVVHCSAMALTVRMFDSAKVYLNIKYHKTIIYFGICRDLALHTITPDKPVEIGMQNSGNGSWIHLIYVLNLNELIQKKFLYRQQLTRHQRTQTDVGNELNHYFTYYYNRKSKFKCNLLLAVFRFEQFETKFDLNDSMCNVQ